MARRQWVNLTCFPTGVARPPFSPNDFSRTKKRRKLQQTTQIKKERSKELDKQEEKKEKEEKWAGDDGQKDDR